jgi:hypothetical protein
MKEQLKMLNKKLKQIDKRLSAKVVFSRSSVMTIIYFRPYIFKKSVGEVTANSCRIVNPKYLGIETNNKYFVHETVSDYQKYLKG